MAMKLEPDNLQPIIINMHIQDEYGLEEEFTDDDRVSMSIEANMDGNQGELDNSESETIDSNDLFSNYEPITITETEGPSGNDNDGDAQQQQTTNETEEMDFYDHENIKPTIFQSIRVSHDVEIPQRSRITPSLDQPTTSISFRFPNSSTTDNFNEKNTNPEITKSIEDKNPDPKKYKPLIKFKYGISAKDLKNGRLIVYENSIKAKVRQYAKANATHWYCLECRAMGKNDALGILIDKVFYAPKFHRCKPISYKRVLGIQKRNKRRLKDSISKNSKNKQNTPPENLTVDDVSQQDVHVDVHDNSATPSDPSDLHELSMLQSLLSSPSSSKIPSTNTTRVVPLRSVPSSKPQINFASDDNSKEYRKVTLPNYIYGANIKGKNNSRLIVLEENDPTMVRQYGINNNIWYCMKCYSNIRLYNHGRLIDGVFNAPISHKCSPMPLYDAMAIQNKLKNLFAQKNSSTKLKGKSKKKLGTKKRSHRKILKPASAASNENNRRSLRLRSDTLLARVDGIPIVQNDEPEREPSPIPPPPPPPPKNITNLLTDDSEIAQRFRIVGNTEFVYGLKETGEENTRLMVFEPDDPYNIRQYSKVEKQQRWYCVSCMRIKRTVNGHFQNDQFYAPLDHHCKPMTYKAAIENQNKIKQRFANSSKSRESSIEIIEEILNNEPSSSQKTTKVKRKKIPKIESEDGEVTSKKSRKEPTATTKASHKPPLIEILDAPISPIQRPIPESNKADTVSPTTKNDIKSIHPPIFLTYNSPSKFWLKASCVKANLPYDPAAYEFFYNVKIDEITPISKPQKIRWIASGEDSSFRALSFSLCGKKAPEIREAVGDYLLNNFKTLGIFQGVDYSKLEFTDHLITKTMVSVQMTPLHWHLISQWLECRVGIFQANDEFEKYGDWSIDDSKVTLLFKVEDQDYHIVLSLN